MNNHLALISYFFFTDVLIKTIIIFPTNTPITISFAAVIIFLSRFSENSRYKIGVIIMFLLGLALLTLGTWVLNDFNFLTITNYFTIY